MTIYLRSEVDRQGDIEDYHWYCSHHCYAASFRETPPDIFGEDTKLEYGGAYPCGAEHDSYDLCYTCEAPIGNPLTPEGEQHVIEAVMGLEYRSETELATQLRITYSYLF